jgi:methyl-accepting chemotaxis protein
MKTMLDWFAKQAPIRTKFHTLLGIMIVLGLTATGATVMGTNGALSATTAIALCAGAMIMAVAILAVAGEMIAAPYVSTVERLEALASNDLSSPIRQTEHGDCVGRMARAMETFRVHAQLQQEQNEQLSHVTVLFNQLGEALKKMGRNQLDCQIRDPFPGL